MNLEEQRNMMERALGERMLNHALVFLRQWAKELGFSPYADRIHSITQNYNSLFDYYMATDDPERDNMHDKLTGETYQLMDEMYAAIRIKRGLTPELKGFDENSPMSVMRYFTSCLTIQEEDLDWLCDVVYDSERRGLALMALSCLSNNLREHFQYNAMQAMIECIDSDNPLISEQAMVFSILLLAQWDARIDYFEKIQMKFTKRLDDGEMAFQSILAIIKAANVNKKDPDLKMKITKDDLPDEVVNLVGDFLEGNENIEDTIERLSDYMPKTTLEYMQVIVDMMPDTWVFDCIVGEDEERIQKVKMAYLKYGSMEYMWDQMDTAEDWLVGRMRKNEATVRDYINYGHILFLRGDRMMAYENYREAKRLCNGNKSFFDLFRPDRKALVDNGIPIEQVYLMEDQLLRQ